MIEKKLVLKKTQYSFLLSKDENISELLYDTRQAARLIYLNAGVMLRSKITFAQVEEMLDWIFAVDDVLNNNASESDIFTCLKKKSGDYGLQLSNENIEDIILLENLYKKLIGIIPD